MEFEKEWVLGDGWLVDVSFKLPYTRHGGVNIHVFALGVQVDRYDGYVNAYFDLLGLCLRLHRIPEAWR